MLIPEPPPREPSPSLPDVRAVVLRIVQAAHSARDRGVPLIRGTWGLVPKEGRFKARRTGLCPLGCVLLETPCGDELGEGELQGLADRLEVPRDWIAHFLCFYDTAAWTDEHAWNHHPVAQHAWRVARQVDWELNDAA